MLWQAHGTMKVLPLRFSTSGDNLILPAPTTCSMMIHALGLIPSDDVTIEIYCGSRLVAEYDLQQYQSYARDDIAGQEGVGVWECKIGEAFTINLSAPVQVTGEVNYSFIDATL